MCGMLINDIKIVMKLYQPVCIKDLTDQTVFRADFPLQQIFLKKIQLLRRLLLHRIIAVLFGGIFDPIFLSLISGTENHTFSCDFRR